MIYTCTLNPSLDYYMEFTKKIDENTINRSELEYYEAGGKGINVSIVLNNLMIPSRALGFLGGFTKNFYIDLLQKYEYIQPAFTYIDGHTRINVKMTGSTETDLNAAGPYITDKDIKMLMAKVQKLDGSDTLVFSGNAPEYLMNDIEALISDAHENNVRIVLDTNPKIISRCLGYKPFLIKPRVEELEEMFECEISDQDTLIKYMKKCHEKGAENVIVQLNDQGALMVNDEGVFHADKVDNEQIVNTVGSGDSMVAGFIMDANRNNNRLENFRFANCCGAATSFSKGLATREKIDSLYNQVSIQKFE